MSNSLTTAEQRLGSVPEIYKRLCRLARELADELGDASEAQKQFDSAAAQNVLADVIKVLGDAAMEISRHYSSSKTGECLLVATINDLICFRRIFEGDCILGCGARTR